MITSSLPHAAPQNRCAMWGRSLISNCYADGGNITSPPAEAERAAAWARGATDALAFEGVSSDPRDPAVAEVCGSERVGAHPFTQIF
jgi:hypothetical protein